jgi:hypothetical protein
MYVSLSVIGISAAELDVPTAILQKKSGIHSDKIGSEFQSG